MKAFDALRKRSRAGRIVLGLVGIGIILALGLLFWASQELGFFAAPDQSILNGVPCQVPCWYGIHPGLTSVEEAMQSLKGNPFVRQQSLHAFTDKQGNQSLEWFDAKGTHFDVAYLSNGVVQILSLEPNFMLPIGEVNAHYGDPNEVQVWYTYYGHDQSGYRVQLLYPQRGFAATLQPQGLDQTEYVPIQPEMKVEQVNYFPPGSLDQIRELVRQTPSNSFLSFLDIVDLQDWHGYGMYRLTEAHY